MSPAIWSALRLILQHGAAKQMLHLPRHSQSPSVPGLSLQLRSGAMTHTRLHCTIWAAQGQVPLLCIISKRNSSVSIACHIGAAAQRCLLLRWCCTQCFPSIKKWRMGMPQLAQTQPRATCCSCGIGPAGSRVRPETSTPSFSVTRALWKSQM